MGLKPFPKGTSGNPGGRSKFAAALAANGLDAKKANAELVGLLIDAARTLPKTTASWRFAMETLMHYINGKPKEIVEFRHGSESDDIETMTDAELDAIIASGQLDDPAVH
jgi:hypothetical protein